MDHADPTGGPGPRPPLVPGLVLGRLLGSGAHGRVWAARDPATGEQVAVKVLAADAADREPALLARVAHEHVVRLRNVVDCPDGSRALVLDLAAGGSLAALLSARGPLGAGECVTVAVALARTLADLHARGLAHGDVSPGNVVLAADGRPLLTDLGAAALVGDTAPTRWATAGFADPRPGPAADPARDVHALGMVLRACLAGPGGATTGDDGSARLLSVADLCTDPDPARRPDAAEVARLVWDAAPARPVRLPPAGGGPSAGPDPQLAGMLPWAAGPAPGAQDVTRRIRESARSAARSAAQAAQERRERRRRRVRRVAVRAVGVFAAAAAVVALVAGGAAVLRAAGGDAPDDAQVAAAVGQLAQARAQAFGSASRAALTGVAEPGSPALAADTALVERLAADGLRLEGLSFTVDDVAVERRARAAVTVTATVTTSAHRRVRADGRVAASVPAGAPQRVRLVLVRHDAGWWVRSAAPA